MKRYYSLYQEGETADLYIYGDITSFRLLNSDVSSYSLSQELKELKDVEQINVYINSYGGEVAEGLAIYNALKRHSANVTTIADGFACSIASVIFAAGDERLMSEASLLMIHNAWSYANGDSNDLRKQADDLEKITQASIKSYMSITNSSEEKIKQMMDEETWLDGNEAIELGFATRLVNVEEKQVATQAVRKQLMQKVNQQPFAQLNLDTEQVETIIDQTIKQTLKDLEIEVIQEDDEEKNKQQDENKPKNMLKALFNKEGE